jgi:predicted component of type VI protein secretion system
MAGNAAIEESTNNLKEHQIAFQAGIQASIEDLLKTFDPKKVEKQFENGIVLQKKSKCWDKYSSSYKNKVDYVIENIYGDAFVDAYERQIRQLKKQRKQNNK